MSEPWEEVSVADAPWNEASVSKTDTDISGPGSEADWLKTFQALRAQRTPSVSDFFLNPHKFAAGQANRGLRESADALNPLLLPEKFFGGAEVGASKLGNAVLDPVHGIFNKAIQALGFEGWDEQKQKEIPPWYTPGQPNITPDVVRELYFSKANPFPYLLSQLAPQVKTNAVTEALSEAASGMTTPGMIATLPAAEAKPMQALFLSQTVPGAIESARQSVNPNLGPHEQNKALVNAGLNTLFSGLLAKGVTAGEGYTPSGVKGSEIDPRLSTGDRDLQAGRVPPERQLPFNLYNPASDVSPVGGARFVMDPAGRNVDVSQLTLSEQRELMRGPREFEQSQKKTFSGDVPIIGGEQQANVPPWKEMVFEQPIQAAYQASGEPKQGGQISFGSEAAAESIPSARQAGIPYDAASEAQGGKMISPEIEGSAKSPSEPISQAQVNIPGLDIKEWAPEGMEPHLQVTDGKGQTVYVPKKGATVESIKQAMADKQAQFDTRTEAGETTTDLNKQLEEDQPHQKLYGGLPLLDPDFWKEQIGFAKGAKVDAMQLYNRVRNKLGEGSATWEMVKDALPKTGKVTTDEAQKMVEENGPKVEVRMFGEGAINPKAKELAELTHWKDGLPARLYKAIDDLGSTHETVISKQTLQQEGILEKAERYNALLRDKEALVNTGNSHWQSIAPKPESSMLGYTEIAVVKPQKKNVRTDKYGESFDEPHQFPSSHSFPPNTLGFTRGYMETLPNGKKVWHVIEVQSDWAQRVRDDEERFQEHVRQGRAQDTDIGRAGYSDFISKDKEPLLSHYERLALKAAIEHARSQGADAIAISDAETAMMTEGHDRGDTWRVVDAKTGDIVSTQDSEYHARELYSKELKEGKVRVEYGPSQEGGMRLHYDPEKGTLHRIARELTGSEGEKVGFGEHKMAMEQGSSELGLSAPRKDLIFRNPDNTPKTDITARMYPLEGARKQFTLTGKDKAPPRATKESPRLYMNPVGPMIKQLGKDVKEGFDKTKEGVSEILTTASMKSVPRTMKADPYVGNLLVRYAASKDAAPALAEHLANEVMGKHANDKAFASKLGAVLVEDTLRGVKGEFTKSGEAEKAAKVSTIIGKPNSPFRIEADYRRAISDPEVMQAIERHKEIVQERAQKYHTQLDGKLAKGGEESGAFVNLKAILGEDSAEAAQSFMSGRGDNATPFKRKSVFSKERQGTGFNYVTDYRELARRMITGNYAEVQKQNLYKALVDRGLAVEQVPGKPAPTLGGKSTSKVQIERRGTPWGSTKVTNLWVRDDVAPELRQALQMDSPLTKGVWGKLGEAITKTQTSLGVDAAWHTSNMLASVNGAVRAQGLKNIFGVREIDTGVRLAKNLYKTLIKDPSIAKDVAEYSIRGAGRGDVARPGLTKLPPIGGKVIKLVDKVGRVTMNQLYNDLVKEGLVKETEQGRREFVNQMGQYTSGLMSKSQQFMRESGLSPFVVAGRTFNRLALKRLTGSPGAEGASVGKGVQMRAYGFLGLLTGLIVVPVLANLLLNGNPFGRSGTPLGAIDTGKDRNGKRVVIDPQKWTMVRRGMQLTGVNALMSDVLWGHVNMDTLKHGAQDAVSGVMHPYVGPAAEVPIILGTGKDIAGYDKAQHPDRFESRAEAALLNVNPVLASVYKGKEEGDVSGNLGKTFGGAVGAKTVSPAMNYDKEKATQGMSLGERRKYEKEQAANKPTYALGQKERSERLALDYEQQKQEQLYGALSPENKKLFEERGLQFRSYQSSFTMGKVKIKLTEAESDRLAGMMAQAYNEKLDYLRTVDNLTQKRLDSNLDSVRKRVISQFKRSMGQ